ncbi:hypothetical protein [Pseudonocardia sp. N23]|uniref:hypothetical protein n=1 Tax=Pseudonocardia sp. N23 TaxID=1987376 RepID=UPI0011459341|nr:hypothetical protein [Pseudonocardia sp. N23]
MAFWRRSGRGPDLHEWEREGILHQETVGGTITYRRFRAPGRYSSWAKEAQRWTVVVTRWRFSVLTGRGVPMVDVPWNDRRFDALDISLDGEKLLVVADVARFRTDSTGTIEVRAKCADAAGLLQLIGRQRRSG